MTAALRYPWDLPPAPAADTLPLPDPETSQAKPKPRGRRPVSTTQAAKRTQPAAPTWLYHHLTINGPADGVETFAATARGSGVIPWRLDFAALEEDVFHRAVAQPAPRSLTVEGCHILARQFRERVEAQQARAVALVGQSVACPFDLHRLRPVPDVILQLGPADPAALPWLTANWGITDRLRQVTVRPNATAGRRLPRGSGVISYGFFTPGETPHAAITYTAAQWPALRFVLTPRPSD